MFWSVLGSCEVTVLAIKTTKQRFFVVICLIFIWVYRGRFIVSHVADAAMY